MLGPYAHHTPHTARALPLARPLISLAGSIPFTRTHTCWLSLMTRLVSVEIDSCVVSTCADRLSSISL